MDDKKYILADEELYMTTQLFAKIVNEGWVDSNTIIVNVSPEYSSRLTQYLNHRLSFRNGNELFEVINLELPKKGMTQVWSQNDLEYQMFDRYLVNWVGRNIEKDLKYLFITNSIFRGKNLNKVRLSLKNKLDFDSFKFASILVQDNSIMVPDYYVDTFKEGRKPVFFWENLNLK